MKVLVLGAGASRPAGYPLGRDLIGAVTAHVAGGVDQMVQWYWGHFADLAKAATGMSKTLLESGNPEVVLSYLDLCAEALVTGHEEINAEQRRVVNSFKALLSPEEQTAFAEEQGERLSSLFEQLEQKGLNQMVRGRLGFIRGLDDFLSWRHFTDAQQDDTHLLYLRRELEWLDDGDVVITTNYDALAERGLLAQRRWSPRDGYGFEVQIASEMPGTLPPWLLKPSPVRVLKLHGSCGWRAVELPSAYPTGGPALTEDVFLDRSYLQYLLVSAHGSSAWLVFDSAEQSAPFPSTMPVLAYPSFLKRTGGARLQAIWEQAQQALRDAREIRVIGSSLPYADAAVRALFNHVRFRLAKSDVIMAVHDRSKTAMEHWREHLGDSVEWVQRYAGESPPVAN